MLYDAEFDLILCGQTCFLITFSGITECPEAGWIDKTPNDTVCPPFRDSSSEYLWWWWTVLPGDWQVYIRETKATGKLKIAMAGFWQNIDRPVFYCKEVDKSAETVANEITLDMCGDDFDTHFTDDDPLLQNLMYGQAIEGYGGSASW